MVLRFFSRTPLNCCLVRPILLFIRFIISWCDFLLQNSISCRIFRKKDPMYLELFLILGSNYLRLKTNTLASSPLVFIIQFDSKLIGKHSLFIMISMITFCSKDILLWRQHFFNWKPVNSRQWFKGRKLRFDHCRVRVTRD